MFTFPKKLPPRHKKKKKKKFSVDAVSDDDVLKEKSNNSEQVDKKVSSMGFGKDVRGKVYLLNKYMHGALVSATQSVVPGQCCLPTVCGWLVAR